MAADFYVTHVYASLQQSWEHLYSSVFVKLKEFMPKLKKTTTPTEFLKLEIQHVATI